jgi:hypothetical protein
MCNGTSTSRRDLRSSSRSLIPTMSSLCPVNVVPSTAATPMVFSSTSGATSSGPIVYFPGWSGTIRGSTSKYRQNFSHTTCTSPPNTRLGLTVGPPLTSRRFRQFHLSESAPSMIASDEPCVRAPVVSPGAWNRSASMRMHRCSIAAVRGYSAWSMKLRCRFSAMSRCASGSIHVVTNVARLRPGSPSRARSSATRRMASTAVIPFSGNSRLGTSWVMNRFPKRAAALVGSNGIDIASPSVGIRWKRSGRKSAMAPGWARVARRRLASTRGRGMPPR